MDANYYIDILKNTNNFSRLSSLKKMMEFVIFKDLEFGKFMEFEFAFQ